MIAVVGLLWNVLMNKTITTLGLVLVVTVSDCFGCCERKSNYSNFWNARLWPVTQLAWMPLAWYSGARKRGKERLVHTVCTCA